MILNVFSTFLTSQCEGVENLISRFVNTALRQNLVGINNNNNSNNNNDSNLTATAAAATSTISSSPTTTTQATTLIAVSPSDERSITPTSATSSTNTYTVNIDAGSCNSLFACLNDRTVSFLDDELEQVMSSLRVPQLPKSKSTNNVR